MAKSGKKIVVLGAGNVGATVAFTLAQAGLASEIVLIDVNADKARGEAMDIVQGVPFCPPVEVYSSDYSAAKDADIVVITAGAARKPGMTRLDLANINVGIVNSIMPQIVPVAPDAVYIVVSNPVDVLTYAIIKNFGLKPERVIGSGTLLDTARLKNALADCVGMNSKDINGYVFGEHGDSSMVPWSLVSVAGVPWDEYVAHVSDRPIDADVVKSIEDDMRTSGAKVIKLKGATFYAVALSVRRICECVLRDTKSVLSVSNMINGTYGIEDVCLSLPFVVGAGGILRQITPPMTDDEIRQLQASGEALKTILGSVELKAKNAAEGD